MTAIEVYRTAEKIPYRHDNWVQNKAESERFEKLWTLAQKLAPTKQNNDYYCDVYIAE